MTARDPSRSVLAGDEAASVPPRPTISALERGRGVQLIDPIEDARFTLFSDRPIEPAPCEGDDFPIPVDTAATVDAARLETPIRVHVLVRDAEGTMIAEATDDDDLSLPAGRYVLELASTPMKVYVVTDGHLEIDSARQQTTFELDDGPVRVGIRSFHDRPARTITTTTEVEDVMEAVSVFGAALKSTTSERSFPTLRGHPPLLEVGEEFHVPPGFERPETGVAIEIPPAFEYLYPVTSLAYYLGAEVRPGERPALVVGGEPRPLGEDGTPESVSRAARDLLKHCFTLDCVVRTEGYYQVDLAERAVVEEELAALDESVDFDPATLYGLPLAEQLERYLDVPRSVTAAAEPRWRLTADVAPTADHVGTLSFLANELAAVRCPEDDGANGGADEPEGLSSFFRGGDAHVESDGGTDVERSGAGTTARSEVDGTGLPSADRQARSRADEPVEDVPIEAGDIVRVRPADSVAHAWIGDGFPLGASKASELSYRRQLARHLEGRARIGVTVICNDEQMREETVVGEFYGMRDLLEFDVDLRNDLTRAEVCEVLESDVDFLHYIGHVDARGLQCADGYLSPDAVADLDVVVGGFFLNACRSFKFGQTLIDRGAIAGVVTLARVQNRPATDIGRTVARLVNAGWPLDTALSLVQDRSIAGRNYIVVGDGTAELVQCEAGTPIVADVTTPGARRAREGSPNLARADGGPRDSEDGQLYKLEITAFPSRNYSLGTLYRPHLAGAQRSYLNSGSVGSFDLTKEELAEFVTLGAFPVRFDGKSRVRWSQEIDVSEL